MTPLVSIIIPTYNRADLIGETLDSVLNQTYINWECIIIDDGSTDHSLVVIQKYSNIDSRFKYLSRPNYKKKGPSACRNYGIEKAKGEFVIFLDSDDLLAKTCLEYRIKFASQNPEYDFWIFKMSAFINTVDNIVFIYENIKEQNESQFCEKAFMKGKHPFVVAGPLWKRKVLIDMEGFNEEMRMIEDPELHLRSLKNGYKLKFSNYEKPDCFYRQKIINKCKITKLEVENNFIFFKIHLNQNDRDIIFYFKKMFNILIFDEFYFIYFFHFSLLALKKHILTNKNILNGIIVIIYKITGLYRLQGSGYHYFKRQFNNF